MHLCSTHFKRALQVGEIIDQLSYQRGMFPKLTRKTLTCSGKIAGLGNVSTVSAQLFADATTQCTNPAQNIPPGHQHVAGTPATLSVSNGQTVFTLGVSASANCSPPHTGSVTFTNVGVAVGGTILPIPGTFDP